MRWSWVFGLVALTHRRREVALLLGQLRPKTEDQRPKSQIANRKSKTGLWKLY
jgi:hypothetical protein